ncbi:4'-phosphopantetheinyl transferase family protein [Scandinavium sp. NPDC088450]|uniref:4'-phosphopantetheinyl transferase family protein n=1 Tax=Scandinavium sp. NPDC088450 TaxID=3364514 RepID=UPI00384D25CA
MAMHFARGILNDGHLHSVRLSSCCHNEARQLPQHRRSRFLASRSLLAELLFMLYGIRELPDIITRPDGKPVFRDSNHPRFSIAYAGNIVGVALSTEGECGLDMELQRATRGFHSPAAVESYPFSSNENLWIKNQNDPNEARAQLMALRQSVLKLTGETQCNSQQQLQLLPGSGRLRAARVMKIEAICDAEDVLVWSIAATPAIERLKVWEYDSKTGWRGLPDMQVRASEPAARLMRFTSLPAEKALILN